MTREIVKDRAGQIAQHGAHDDLYAGAHDPVHDVGGARVQQLVAQIAGELARTLVADTNSAACERLDLANLTALMAVRAAAEALAARAAKAAAEHGVRYPAIASAAGTSRQNARVRWPGLTAVAQLARVSSASTSPSSGAHNCRDEDAS